MKRIVLILLAACALAACHRGMEEQPKRKPLTASPLFQDGAASRPRVDDTVAQEDAPGGPFGTGTDQGLLVAQIPVPVTPQLLARGQERYGIFCAVCHGADGDGEGIVVRRGFPPPPSLHEERLRTAPAGHFFDVMTRGYGAMYSYADRLSPADRWAITAYIRALQLSHDAPANALPEALRQKLEGGSR